MNACFVKNISLSFFMILSSQWLLATELAIPFVKQNGLILIEAEIDAERGWFVFDSGADHILIHESKNVKNEEAVVFATLDGEAFSTAIQINNLRVGNVAKSNFEAYGADLSLIQQFAGREIKGILNAAFFNPQSISLNLAEGMIYLYEGISKDQIDRFDYHVSYNASLGVPIIDLSLKGTVYRFILDSGATANLIDQELVNSLSKNDYQEEGFVDIVTVGSKTQSKIIKMEGWKVSEKALIKNSFVVKDLAELNAGLDKADRVVGLISLETLSEKEILINLYNEKIYF